MQGSARQRLLLGLASSAMGQALAGAQALLLVPLFVSAWAPDQYGRWLALGAIASHLTIADLGGQIYLANLLAIHFGRGEQAAFRERLSEAVSLFLLVGLGLLALLVIGLAWAIWGLVGPSLTGNEALALLFLGTNAVILSVPGGVYATVYRASGQFARGALIGNLGKIVNIAGTVALLVTKSSPAAVAGWILASAAATTVALVIDSRRVIPDCRDVRVTFALARAGVRRLASGSLHFCVISIASEVNQQGVVLILAAMASPVAVVIYSTHRVLASIPNRLATLVQGPASPELSFLWARRQHAELIEMTLLATTTFMAVGALASAALWMGAPFAYGAWTSHAVAFEPVLACVLIVQGLLASGWQTSAWSLLATNQHHALAWWSAAKAALTVLLAWQLAGPFGAAGVAIAALAADIACGALVFPARAATTLGAPAAQFYNRVGLGLIPLVPLVLSAADAASLGLGSDDAGRAAASVLASVLAAAIAWPFVMPKVRSLHLRWRAGSTS